LTSLDIICKLFLTGSHGSKEGTLTSEKLLTALSALANPLRLRIIAQLSESPVHISELARRLGMSRPLLYMHLDKLEKAGIVVGHLELSDDGKAMKYIELAPFELRVTADSIVEALRADDVVGTAEVGDVKPSEVETKSPASKKAAKQ
jgi:DNA-binding transcriptional ArsR family regulator